MSIVMIESADDIDDVGRDSNSFKNFEEIRAKEGRNGIGEVKENGSRVVGRWGGTTKHGLFNGEDVVGAVFFA